MENIIITADSEMSPVIVGGGTPAQGDAPANTEATTTVPPPGDTTGELPPGEEVPASSMVLPTILMYAVLLGAMYFILFRPQRKQAKAMKALRENIRAGDNIVTQSGLYGKVTDIGEDCYIVEFGLNRGVKVPVAKSEVAAIKSPKMTPPPTQATSD